MVYKPLILAVAVLTAFLSGWTAQGWKSDARLYRLEAEQLRAVQILDSNLRKAEQEAATKLAELDKQKTQEIQNAKRETTRLRRCIAAGTCGVRINTTTAASTGSSKDGSPSSVDSEAPNLAADVQQRILDLREAVETDSAALRYLQEYAKQCYQPRN